MVKGVNINGPHVLQTHRFVEARQNNSHQKLKGRNEKKGKQDPPGFAFQKIEDAAGHNGPERVNKSRNHCKKRHPVVFERFVKVAEIRGIPDFEPGGGILANDMGGNHKKAGEAAQRLDRGVFMIAHRKRHLIKPKTERLQIFKVLDAPLPGRSQPHTNKKTRQGINPCRVFHKW